MLMNSGIYTASLPRQVLPRVSFESLCQSSPSIRPRYLFDRTDNSRNKIHSLENGFLSEETRFRVHRGLIKKETKP